MSISAIQTRMVIEDLIRTTLSGGVVPDPELIIRQTAEYFSKYPAGLPLPLYLANIDNGRVSNVDTLNESLANIGINLQVLYDVCFEHINELMATHSMFNDKLDQLRVRRKRLEAVVDDFLLSQYNTDGYFYSISDTFSDTSLTDLALTSAYIDVSVGNVTIPSLSHATRRIPGDIIEMSGITVTGNRKPIPFTELAPFSGSVRSLSNSFWGIEVTTDARAEIVVNIDVTIAQANNPSQISRIEFDPYGITPVQVLIKTNRGTNSTKPFGGRIETSKNRMVFIDNLRKATQVSFTLRKTNPDYVDSTRRGTVYRYIFGAKDIAFLETLYDSSAIFVTKSLSLPADMSESDYTLDAVSLYAEDIVPEDTTLQYYIAEDVTSTNPTLASFNWKPITPITDTSSGSSSVVRFNGATTHVEYIREEPQSDELAFIPIDIDTEDLTNRNPSPIIIPGKDVYRICKFTETPLLSSLKLYDGVNSLSILTSDYNETAVASLDYWIDKVSDQQHNRTFNKIDSTADFFYGGTIGRSGRSIYVETYLDAKIVTTAPMSEFVKSDSNSKTWDVRVILNGKSIAWLPQGVDSAMISWPFAVGLNHIVLLVNIPYGTTTTPNPYLGSLELMRGHKLYEYGNVYLSEFAYVDPFDIEYNSMGTPKTFTIYNEEIISLAKPSGNLILHYATANSSTPKNVRFRADLTRGTNNPNVTPVLGLYRLRFSIGDNDNNG